MSIWGVLLWLGVAGGVGGALNALLADAGFKLWRMETLPDGSRILRPGFLGNILIGAAGAVLLASLHSPLGATTLGSDQAATFPLTITGLAGALLSGIGGAKIITELANNRVEEVTRGALGKTVADLTTTLQTQADLLQRYAAGAVPAQPAPKIDGGAG